MEYAVITGASSGIGACFARRFAREGFSLVLVARREERLWQLKEELLKENPKLDILVLALDLTDLGACDTLMDRVMELPVRFFINNAGFGDCGIFTEGDIKKELGMIDLNIKTLHYLTKKALICYENREDVYILNVGSSAGLLPAGPYMATYYASKAYVVSLTRAIAEELKEQKKGCYIGVLCPGPVDTEFNRVANVRFALKGITPEACVDYAYRQMLRRKVTIVPTAGLRIAITWGRLLPVRTLTRMCAHQQKKKIYA